MRSRGSAASTTWRKGWPGGWSSALPDGARPCTCSPSTSTTRGSPGNTRRRGSSSGVGRGWIASTLKDGFSFATEQDQPGFGAVVRHWEPYSVAAVERVLAEFSDSIIDFGAGHAHYEDPELQARLERALAPLRHVVLLQPSTDVARSEEICRARDEARFGSQWDPSRAEVNARFVRSECFRRVATHEVYAEERTVDEIVDEIVSRIEGPSAP